MDQHRQEEQELPLQPDASVASAAAVNHVVLSHRWIRLLLIGTTVKSILGLVILIALLVVSTSVFLVGVHFRHSHYCPMETRISLFLLVAGGLSIVWIILSLVLSIITIVRTHIRWLPLVVFIVLLASVILIINMFWFVWVICGSVWTLRVFDAVQYNDSSASSFCHRSLYQFALSYLIFTYILTALQCWYRLCIVIFCSVQERYGV